METILKSDIFFMITSVSVIIITIIIAIAGYYIIRIVKTFSEISKVLKDTVDEAHGELKDMTDHVKNSSIFTFIFGKGNRRKKN